MIWWLFCVCLPFVWFMWTLIHEAAHAITARAFGHTVLSFKPFPHKADGKFYWGRVTYKYQGKDQWLIKVMPYIVDLVVAIGFGVGMILVDDPEIMTVLAALYVAPLVNTGSVVQARYRKNIGDLAAVPGGVHWGIALAVFWVFVLMVVGATFWVSTLF